MHTVGKRLRGRLTFAPQGISEIADQVHRQVKAGITSTVSIGFMGTPTTAESDHRIWRDNEVLELSFVSVPSSRGARVDGKAMKRWLGRDEPYFVLSDDPVYEVDEDLLRQIPQMVSGIMQREIRRRRGQQIVEFDADDLADVLARRLVATREALISHHVDEAIKFYRGLPSTYR